MNWQEVLSEISGSWEFCVVVGFVCLACCTTQSRFAPVVVKRVVAAGDEDDPYKHLLHDDTDGTIEMNEIAEIGIDLQFQVKQEEEVKN